jgi:biopolymer transport protein ExbD
MKLTPLQKRAERRSRNTTMVDMNLVSLIDVFTILIFFLLSSAGVESALVSSKAVTLPTSNAEKAPRETLVLVVSETEILAEGRKVADVADALALKGDAIPALQSELEILAQRQTVRSENADKGKAVTILGDKDIPYRLLRKVMVTAARAGFADVSFAVQQKASL